MTVMRPAHSAFFSQKVGSLTVFKLLTTLSRPQKSAVLFVLDIGLIILSFMTALWLVSPTPWTVLQAAPFWLGLGIMVVVGVALILGTGLHKVTLNAYQIASAATSAFVALTLSVIGIAFALSSADTGLSPATFVVSGLLFLTLSIAARLMLRRGVIAVYRRHNARLPVLIYGAGQTGQQLAVALSVDKTVAAVAFLDDDPRIQGLKIGGLKVYHSRELTELVKTFNIKRVVLAMPDLKPAEQSTLTMRVAQAGVDVHVLPSFADLITRRPKPMAQTQPVDINALLGRDGLDEDLPGVSAAYEGRNILVTGAGGSIGSELSRQLLKWKPKSLILFDHSELALYDIHRELSKIESDTQVVAVLGSVLEADLVRIALRKYKVNIVLHAAAYKHVPLVEENALEGIRNNVFGTKAAAEASRSEGVERFILVSTDKAVRPTSIMGASKRFAEMVVQDLATRTTDTRFSMVRFGNVLGSSGSVIPLFQEQIARGGPLTLTDLDVTRYFMTIPEAVQLVLLAGSFARGGDVFVLDMGEPVRILDLAEKMIRNAGLRVRDEATPEGEIDIEVTGLRPGEKLHEELLIGSDMLTTPHAKILRAQESHLSEIEMAKALQSLWQSIETRSPALLQETLRLWIERQAGRKIEESWHTVNH